ncbi:MAG: ABC transporter ATP-binding protein [Clostridiaceae bacterium]|nr:ABC transporter ATP-binding protein [Clostridiaceae bacterium]
MIDMKEIVKKYQMGSQTVYALNGVTMKISDGEFVAVVGPSGSGKSTLMNIIGCLDVADSGQYELNGKPIAKYSERQLARIRNENIGFIFQGFNLLPNINALENVELPLIYQNLNHSRRKKQALDALERVGLSDRIRHRPGELSGGQQQRVAVARAIAGKPSMILADEPTGNLDTKTGKEIIGLLRELHNQGNTIVLITHDSTIAAQAQRCVYIEDGYVKGGVRT